jgi:hypothetical protein
MFTNNTSQPPAKSPRTNRRSAPGRGASEGVETTQSPKEKSSAHPVLAMPPRRSVLSSLGSSNAHHPASSHPARKTATVGSSHTTTGMSNGTLNRSLRQPLASPKATTNSAQEDNRQKKSTNPGQTKKSAPSYVDVSDQSGSSSSDESASDHSSADDSSDDSSSDSSDDSSSDSSDDSSSDSSDDSSSNSSDDNSSSDDSLEETSDHSEKKGRDKKDRKVADRQKDGRKAFDRVDKKTKKRHNPPPPSHGAESSHDVPSRGAPQKHKKSSSQKQPDSDGRKHKHQNRQDKDIEREVSDTTEEEHDTRRASKKKGYSKQRQETSKSKVSVSKSHHSSHDSKRSSNKAKDNTKGRANGDDGNEKPEKATRNKAAGPAFGTLAHFSNLSRNHGRFAKVIKQCYYRLLCRHDWFPTLYQRTEWIGIAYANAKAIWMKRIGEFDAAVDQGQSADKSRDADNEEGNGGEPDVRSDKHRKHEKGHKQNKHSKHRKHRKGDGDHRDKNDKNGRSKRPNSDNGTKRRCSLIEELSSDNRPVPIPLDDPALEKMVRPYSLTFLDTDHL